MIKAIIFDAYGTLISTGDGSLQAAEKILLLNGRNDISSKDFYSQWKSLHRKHIDELRDFVREEDIFKKDLRQLYKRYNFQRNADEDVSVMLNTLGKRIAFPEAREVLERLSQKYILAIGSTTDTKPLLDDIKNNHLKIERVFTSESLRAYKPRMEFYEKILDELNVKASESLFVGDSLIDDIAGPQSVGMLTCWINRKHAAAGEYIPNYEISNLKGLFDIL